MKSALRWSKRQMVIFAYFRYAFLYAMSLLLMSSIAVYLIMKRLGMFKY